MKSKLIVALSLLALAAVFALQNASEVKVRFLFWSLSSSLALLVVLLLLIGVAVGWMLGALARRRRGA